MIPKTTVLTFVSITVFIAVSYLVFRDTIIERLLQNETCDEHDSCVRFCCEDRDICTNDTELRGADIPNGESLRRDFTILKGKSCSSLTRMDDARFMEDGRVIDAKNVTYDWNKYCFHYNPDGLECFVLSCLPTNIVEDIKRIYPYLMISSVPFLIATLVIYALVPDLRNMHGKCVMGYVLSLTLMYSSLAAIGEYNKVLLENHNVVCRGLGYTFMTAILMSFFWLNVMCFDTWGSIRSMIPRRYSTKRFIYYCLYAFGLPTALVLTVAVLNELKIIPEAYATGIGVHSCTVSDPLNIASSEVQRNSRRNQFMYLFGPISVVLLVNFGFYATTAYTIHKVRDDVRSFSREGNSRHTKRESARFALYVRFFVMMGLPWAIEIISWIFEGSVILYLTSTINCLQGFVIHVTFIWRKQMIHMIKNRGRRQNERRAYMKSTFMSINDTTAR